MTNPERQIERPITRRKPGKVRRLEIAEVAAELFATHGFSVSTRAISDTLGITQAALYKHFQSKQELVDEVFRTRYLDEKQSDFSSILEATDRPLSDRLTDAYVSFFNQITESSLKLFHRASYDGLEIARRYSPYLDERILQPILEQLRSQSGLAALDRLSETQEERELVLMLHSTVVFLAIRKHVYHIDFRGREPEVIRLHVHTWLSGALNVIHGLSDRVG